MTGSQCEPLAARSRISRGDHPQVKVKTTGTIIFSASPIPGNTISVVNTIDKLMMLGAKVVYGKGEGIHVSGHGFQEDQKLLLALAKIYEGNKKKDVKMTIQKVAVVMASCKLQIQ